MSLHSVMRVIMIMIVIVVMIMIVVMVVNVIVAVPVAVLLAIRDGMRRVIKLPAPQQLMLLEILRAVRVIVRVAHHPTVQKWIALIHARC